MIPVITNVVVNFYNLNRWCTEAEAERKRVSQDQPRSERPLAREEILDAEQCTVALSLTIVDVSLANVITRRREPD